MSTFTDSAIVEGIDLSGIDLKAKGLRLNGGVNTEGNVMTGAQLATILKWMVQNYPKDTVLNAANKTRVQFHLVGNSADYNMVEPITDYWNAHPTALELTPAQVKLFKTCRQALSGVKAHRDPEIARLIATADRGIKAGILAQFNAVTALVEADEDVPGAAELRQVKRFHVAMTSFEDNFGKPVWTKGDKSEDQGSSSGTQGKTLDELQEEELDNAD